MALKYVSADAYSLLNGKTFVEKLGFKGIVANLSEMGWQFKLTSSSLSLIHGTQKLAMPVDVKFLQALGEDQADPAQLELFKKTLDQLLYQAWEAPYSVTGPSAAEGKGVAALVVPVHAAEGKLSTDYIAPTQENEDAFFKSSKHIDKLTMIKAYRALFGAGLKEAKDAVEAYLAKNPKTVGTVTMNASPVQLAAAKMAGPAKWPMFDPAKLQTDPVVKLRDAKQMYQPVRGSGGTSRYFLLAANDDIRVAARYMTKTLSIRIEGPAWKKHKAMIAQSGFSTVDEVKDYASVHLVVDDEMLAMKSLGAVLLGLGVQFETPMPMLSVIKGKGS